MLQEVVLQTTPPKTFAIDAVDPDEIIIVKSISGLDPAALTLFTGDFARDGGYYQGRRSEQRNPVFNLKLNPDYAADVAVSDIREMLYGWFLEPSATSDGLQVVLKDDRRPDRYFTGYTENIPSDIFTNEPTAQISMLCVDPWIWSLAPVTETLAAGWTTRTLPYQGSKQAGFQMTLLVKTATNQVIIDLDGVKMTLNKSFAVNDVITINTSKGFRYIRQNGSDIMVTLSSTSSWLLLRKGSPNLLKIHGGVENDGKVVMTDYIFQDAWWGI
jgi:hypothetical protein